ncbi:MAG TPA: hypothetical protein PK156_46810 [Polyangium sp.]|nr:hypothetical protein [Polyangium sp.]
MRLEGPQILRCRGDLIKQWRAKEWWYTGVVDEQSNIYVSWYFVRVNLIDSFVFTVFDPSADAPIHFEVKGWLDKSLWKEGRLDLSLTHPHGSVVYEGSAETGWRLSLSCKGIKAELKLTPTDWPVFAKFDNELVDWYGLLHFFQVHVSGSIQSRDRTWEIAAGRAYWDHCFGLIPSRTGWHWLAVQNADVALSSLVNYGAYAQRYTQVFLRGGCGRAEATNRWIRLNQDVSFEQEPPADMLKPWNVTSTEMDLVVTPVQRVTDVQRIPPISPFIIDLKHTEWYVTAKGRLRVENEWLEVQNLRGVMEQHSGRW